MKTLIASLAFALAASPLQAAVPAALPGVSEQETTIPAGGISRYHRGKGDVLFVLDRAGRWYRLGLNEGCLSASPRIETVAFGYSNGIQRVDHFTRVLIAESRGGPKINCRIESIRRSEAPPQVDSDSPVTLD